MQSNDDNNVAITLLDKEFLIHCPEEAQAELLRSARLLDQRLREIKTGGRVFGMERIAVMAALNLSHELLQKERELNSLKQAAARLENRINGVLQQSGQSTSERPDNTAETDSHSERN